VYHYIYDAHFSYRARLDDLRLVYEILEDLPSRLKLKALAPPFILPYYSGAEPEDCGISAFIFLEMGHITLHTFSFREGYYLDLCSEKRFDPDLAKSEISRVFPAAELRTDFVKRVKDVSIRQDRKIDKKKDFGPHLLINLSGLENRSFEDLFCLFDRMPFQVGMTPIMRPYGIISGTRKRPIWSIMTMIAESHISLHMDRSSGDAYFDLFSCSFFPVDPVTKKLFVLLGGKVESVQLISRGHDYQTKRSTAVKACRQSREWLRWINKDMD